MNWKDKVVLVTGGTGSFGKKFIEIMLKEYHPSKIIIFSRDELKQLSGVYPDDLHKQYVDKITIPCPKCGKEMRRIPEVFDCWFESGSMPYASKHYMGQDLEKNGDCLVSKDGNFKFPADFIAEGLDQTR